MRKINSIIIHCSASDYAHHDNLSAIRHWHVRERGFSDIGYHFVITKDGSVKVGRPLERVGAHCKGFNQFSIGICLTGKDYFSSEQFTSLHVICLELCEQFGLALSNIKPHNSFNKQKTCPNFDLIAQKALWIQ